MEGRNVKEDWQATNVEGYAYYTPTRISWKYKYQIPCDLAVENLRASKMEFKPEDTIKFDWNFVNHGQQAVKEGAPEIWAHLLVNGQVVKYWKVEDLPPVEQKLNDEGELVFVPSPMAFTYEYTVPKEYTGGGLDFEVRINMVPENERQMIEEDYDNNVADIRLQSDQWDFAVTSLRAEGFRPGEPVVGSFVVKNNATRTYAEDVEYLVTIDGETLDRGWFRNLGAGASRTIHFISSPDLNLSEGTHTLRVEVNHRKLIDEITYTNNVKTLRTGILQNPSICRGNNLHAEGVYYMPVGGENKGGTVVYTYTEPITDGDGNVIGHRIIGYDKSWYVNMSVTQAFSTQTLKSGHGFQCRANVSISTNLLPGNYSLPTAAILHGDSGITQMEMTSGGGKEGTYELVRHATNPLRERKHFIPVSWKDGPYKFKLCFAGASTLGESLSSEENFTATIKGHMYMDDVTY